MGKLLRGYERLKKSMKPYNRLESDVGRIFKDVGRSAQSGRLARLDRAFSSPFKKEKKEK